MRPEGDDTVAERDGGQSGDSSAVVTSARPPGPPSAASSAVARHRARMRRRMWVFVAVLAVLAIAGTVVVARVWVTGEVHNTRLHTVAAAPSDVPPAPASAILSKAWDTGDTAAVGTPVWRGTVITYDGHTVRGRDARDGTPTWSYYRSNRTLCIAAQANGVTMALYRVNGNCDELTALDSGTGKRRWTRTLDMDGHPVDGTPTVTTTPYTLMVSTSSVIYALDPGSGYDRWEFHPQGCRIQRAVIGSSGALISQVCDAPACNGNRNCGAGTQLLLRDPYAGHDDKNSTLDKDGKNPDQILWNRFGDTDIPASADAVVAALNRTTRAVDVLDGHTGNPVAEVRLVPAPTQLNGIVAVPTSSTELVWIHGIVYAISTDNRQVWTQPSSGPPTVLGTTPTEWPAAVATARVTVTAAGGEVRTVAAERGTVARRSRGASTTPGSIAFPLGSGFLVENDGGVVVYR